MTNSSQLVFMEIDPQRDADAAAAFLSQHT